MTIMEAIRQVDTLKPNAYTVPQKILWLSRLEAMVKQQVLDVYGETESLPFTGFGEDTDPGTRLFMEAPFDMAYLYWLEAQIHYANEDMESYNSAILMFHSIFGEFTAHYMRNHATVHFGRFRF